MNKIWKIQNAIPLHYVRNYAFILLNNCSKLNWNSGFHYSQFQTLKYYSTDLTRKESEYDIVIVGGGIIGTASARELLLRNSGLKIAIVEKENKLAAHQSGHNSGVLHAGIYYKPGSLKAKLCVEGIDLSYKYYDEEGIPYKKLGKLIVATDKSEIPRLLDLHERALKNNVPGIKLIDGHQIKEHEPYCKGVKALWSPQTGIVDFELVTKHYGKNVVDRGGKIHLNFEVTGFESVAESQIGSKRGNEYPIRVKGKGDQSVRCRYVLTCGGLQSDRLAELSGCSGDPHIVPFRGEYLLLKPQKSYLVQGNIYPVPDPRFPFLGVHFTPRMNGDIWLGPNALLALKREGYKWSDIDLKDFMTALRYRGFQRLAMKYVSVGFKEVTCSAFPYFQVRSLQRYIPEITTADIVRGPSGVRAQAMRSDGSLEEDFVFQREKDCQTGSRILHCRNAPSPGATSSLAIAKMIANKLHEEFDI
ncbi:UNVERIFIED_CONTAM: hypothetical protein RMT77_000927 [Armadillidium vulgare]